jgi:aminotransferase
MSSQTNKAPGVVARRVAEVRPSVLAGLQLRAQELRAAGQTVIDLGAGVADYPPPAFLLAAAHAALDGPFNSYGDARGLKSLREAVADHYRRHHLLRYDADREVTITAGASAALSAVLLSLVNPGDGVAIFEPFFEMFLPQIKLAGGRPKFIKLHAPDWSFDEDELARALSGRTRFLLLNTPHNPTGRVFTPQEIHVIADICRQRDIIVISDETYEPFVFHGAHTCVACGPAMQQRSIIIGSMSKALNVGGWRLGSVVAPAHLTAALRLVNGLSLGAAVPLQQACAEAMADYDRFTAELVQQHRPLRDALCQALAASGFVPFVPEGTLSVWAEAGCRALDSDLAVCRMLLDRCGILAAPGSAFFRRAGKRQYLRFSFARSESVIAAACQQLISLGN